MSVRTYNPSVRVGNWNEDIQLEEDVLKDFLERRARGELLIQKSASLKNTVLGRMELSISRDGCVMFGDKIMLVNPGGGEGRAKTALSVIMTESVLQGNSGDTECGVTASQSVEPSARTAFAITSCDGTPEGVPLKYGQPFLLRTVSGNLFLHSDRATFQKCAKKSRHNEVLLVPKPDSLTRWFLTAVNTEYRLELEGTPVPVNQPVILTHLKTNQNLCVEEDHLLSTPFGREYEVSTYTMLDSHKAEKDANHWMLVMSSPGDPVMPVQSPEEAAKVEGTPAPATDNPATCI